MLQDRRVQGKRVLLLYPPGLEFSVGLWGCSYAGAIAVLAPLPVSGLQTEPHRIVDLINDSTTRLILTVASLETQLVETLATIDGLAHLKVISSDSVDPEIGRARVGKEGRAWGAA